MKTLIQRIKEHVNSKPDQTALVFQDDIISYAKLDELSGRIATAVLANGAKRESIIPIYLKRSAAYIVAQLGILKAGAAFAPLSIEYPQDRLDYIKNDCGCPFVLDEAFYENALQAAPLHEPVATDWQDAALVLYTSGSTGNPKGIVHTQYSFSRAIMRQLPYGCPKNGIELCLAPFHFAISNLDAHVTLWQGAPLHILSEEDRKDIPTIENYIDTHGITSTVISLQLLKFLPDRKSSLVNICCGGERLSGISRKNGVLRNIYGLSEVLSAATTLPVDKAYDNTPIGLPLEDFTIYLLDEQNNLVEDGKEGEICIAGPLARGYLNLPEQTAKAFVENPFSTKEMDARMLRTGDVGKRLPGGEIVYTNRKDWMVKVNGQRVEMGEVEIQIGKIPKVHTAVVKSFEDENGQTYLCGYFSADDTVSDDDVRVFLAQKFPDYMIPRFLVKMDSLPLNANGKLDRKGLKPPQKEQFQKLYVAPESPLQQEICEGFEQVLKLQSVGIDDDFFSLGGDSVKVVNLQEKLQHLSLSSGSIFKERTPRNLARWLHEGNSVSLYANMDFACDAYTMTDSQLGIYLDTIHKPSSLMYNCPFRLFFSNEYNVDSQKMQQALRTVIDSYPILKVHVEMTDGLPSLVPNAPVRDTRPVILATGKTKDELTKEFIQPFDLSTGPLFRFSLYTLNDGLLLLGDIHHLVTDGTSMAIFFDNLMRAYEGKELQAENISSFALCNYAKTLEKTQEYEASRQYFHNLLSGVEVDSNLLFDETAQGEEREKVYEIHKVHLAKQLSGHAIREYAKSLALSEGALFLSVFAYALAKMTGQNESLFCTVSHGRHVAEVKHTMGMLVRTLPIYVQLDEEQTIEEYTHAVKEQFFHSIQKDSYSFIKLAAEYGVTSDILFAYQGELFNSVSFLGKQFELESIKSGENLTNLTLELFKKGDEYELWFEYNTENYLPSTIESFGRLYTQVLQGFLLCNKLKDLPLCGSQDLSILKQFNSNDLPINQNLTVVDLLRERFAKSPHLTAIVYEDKSLTFAQLDEQSERLAKYLAKIGIRPGHVVGIMVNRSELYPICTIGTLKAGGVCLPLDTSYPADRLQYMLSDAKADVLIIDRCLQTPLDDFHGQILYADEISSLPVEDDVILHPPKPEDLFCLLYTSGSTGKPKGVMLQHKNLVNLCFACQRNFGLCEEDRAGAYASFSFDMSMFDFYPTLFSGTAVHIIPEETRLDLAALHEFYLSHKITFGQMTTQLGRQFVCQYPNAPHMRVLIVGGEKLVPCPPPKYALYNGYGPTETTVLISKFKVDKMYHTVPIGSPYSNNDVYIVDPYHRTLPVGAPGEVCISGASLSLGYLNKPELTAEKFVPNPFNKTPGYERMYLTGDVCRFTTDGNLHFIGRRDEQVKIRGFRIELGEIEQRIEKFDGIERVCVVARDLPAGGKVLVAYVVAPQVVDTQALNAFVGETLPNYMVPSITMQLDALPLSPNGKVDRRHLPQPEQPEPEAIQSQHTLNRLENELIELVSQITGQKSHSLDAQLVNLGLSSLSMMMLATKIYDRFGLNLSVSKLLDGGTLLDVENELLEFLLSKPQDKEILSDVKVQETDSLPLSSAQLSIYYDSIKRPNALVYNIPVLYRFAPSIDGNKLADAVQSAISARPLLSVHVENQSGTLCQRFQPNAVADIPVLSMDETAFSSYKTAFAKPFDLSSGPLYRAAVVTTGTQVYLLFDVHHLVFDGMSLTVFLQTVQEAYEGKALTPETLPFSAAISAEKEAEEGERGTKTLAYYDALFKDFETASAIAPDLNGKAEDGKLGECVTKVDRDAVEQFCLAHGLTPAGLFLSASTYALSRYTNERRVFLSMVSSGREDVRLQKSVGMFVKTLPLSLSVQPGQTSLSFMKEVGKAMHSAISHSDYPFLKLQEHYSYSPKINYACQLGLVPSLEFCGTMVEQEVLTMPLPKFGISIHIETREGTPAVCLQYNDALYSKRFAQGLCFAISTALNEMMQTPEGSLVSVSLLSSSAKEKMHLLGQGELAPPQETLFHRCFERCAMQNPSQKALIACDATFTYQELDKAINRVANGLLEAGLKKQDRVLLLLPRTSRQIIAMYAVLKAGGVYIPCDPHHPKERIRTIANDSEASFVLSTKNLAAAPSTCQTLEIETLLNKGEDTAPNIDLSADDLAYLIYTSGSTGKPKGVMLTHGGISNYLTCHPENRHIYALSTDAKVLISVTTVSFDMSLKETAAALCNGLCLVLANEDEANNPLQLAELFASTGADAFNATPSRMAQYLEVPGFCKALKQCTVVMCGGEAFSPKLLKQLQAVTDARLFNTYGPTEITVSCNAKELTQASFVNAGRPLLNVWETIRDMDGNLLPQGVTGELYVGGLGVSKGYWHQDELTQQSFMLENGKSVYKTGDYAKWNEDGDVVILGRLDNQVKLRGLRIELGEVQSALLQNEHIKEAQVLIREIHGTEHLCAWFTGTQTVDVKQLKEALTHSLTAYMVPTAFCQLEIMPTTPNGKVDVKALPAPQLLQAAGKGEAPQNEAERILCEVFAEVLQIPTTGATDSFFELGGTSLSATNVLVKASEKGLNLSYADVFRCKTPRSLAALVLSETGVEPAEDDDITQYNYAQFDELLCKNNLESFLQGTQRNLGNILLTGATGFLGIHILHTFLEEEDGICYCLLRSKEQLSAKARLKAQLFYYFENSYDELFDTRIHIVEGDVTKTQWMEDLQNKKIDTLINCAALVKHFSSGHEIDEVNFDSVKGLVSFCKQHAICLVQVSTGSVAGTRINDVPAKGLSLSEEQLYIGQTVDNQYLRSKFLAERLILQATLEGLEAKILRVGNLAARHSDGEFQINFTTNGFVGRLRAYDLIGAFPYSAMGRLVEMSPIDYTAKAVLILCKTPKHCCVFHPSNNHKIPLGDLILHMRSMGMSIQLTEDAEAKKAQAAAQEDPKKAQLLTAMLAYAERDPNKHVEPILVKNNYTTQVLYRLGFHWPITSTTYMEQFLSALDSLGFFTKE